MRVLVLASCLTLVYSYTTVKVVSFADNKCKGKPDSTYVMPNAMCNNAHKGAHAVVSLCNVRSKHAQFNIFNSDKCSGPHDTAKRRVPADGTCDTTMAVVCGQSKDDYYVRISKANAKDLSMSVATHECSGGKHFNLKLAGKSVHNVAFVCLSDSKMTYRTFDDSCGKPAAQGSLSLPHTEAGHTFTCHKHAAGANLLQSVDSIVPEAEEDAVNNGIIEKGFFHFGL